MSSTQESNVTLPRYLARHLDLGFDAEGVAALMSSIDASQTNDSSLPHLPAEILFLVVEFVPIDYILSWRLVCHGVRNYIDDFVICQYLKRTELIAHVNRGEAPGRHSEVEYNRIRFMRARFEGFAQKEEGLGIPWVSKHAIFDIDAAWKRAFSEEVILIDGIPQPRSSAHWNNLLIMFHFLADEHVYGTLRWCLCLDAEVLELEFPVEKLRGALTVDLVSGKVTMEWRRLLFNFLKTVSMLRKMMADKIESKFTYGYEEDCLRAVRRQRLRSALDLDNAAHRRAKWEMDLLPPLFGKPVTDQAAMSSVRSQEKRAIDILRYLRREAAMSRTQLSHLHQLGIERRRMKKEWDEISATFQQWRDTIFSVSISDPFDAGLDELDVYSVPVADDPLEWDPQLLRTEETRIKKWQSQKRTIYSFFELLRASQEAMGIPDDAFDYLGSQI